MPKKRQQFKQYSKPQSTAPANLSSRPTSTQRDHADQPGRSVNQLLADLRRVSVRSSQDPPEISSVFTTPGAPTVPPAIRRILQLPETPAPPPRRPVRVAPNGRRLPPGPAAPRSWLSQSIHAPKTGTLTPTSDSFERHALPSVYAPSRHSLVDITLRKIADDWEFQSSYNRGKVTATDLRAVLLPYVDDEAEDSDEPDPSTANEDITHLDLTGSVGRSLRLRELSDLLFPTSSTASLQTEPLESWDSLVQTLANPAVPRPLLPSLTHLSLAIDPNHSSVSWRHLLSFAAHLPTLTHLSLAYWPEPALTPNAKLASVSISPTQQGGGGGGTTGTPAGGHSVPYGGTGFYSHSLDDDWSEAVLVLRRLSNSLYGLEWLDLTGCLAWTAALSAVADHDFVDWVAAWGKVTTVLLYPGYKLGPDAGIAQTEKYESDVRSAVRLERYIRGRRAGKGRSIEVETEMQVP